MAAHSISVTVSGGGGTASASSLTASAGDLITLTATPYSGYTFNTWYAYTSNGPITIGGTNRFTMPDANVTVIAEFKQSSPSLYSVTVTVNGGHGKASADPSMAASGSEVTLTAVADTGYHLQSWSVFQDGETTPITVTNNKFTMPSGNVSVSCKFASGGGGGGGGGGGAGDPERPLRIADINARAIPVPSIVKYFDDKGESYLLDAEYHARSDYMNAIKKHGIIYKVVQFSEISDVNKIREFAMDWIRRNYYDGVASFTVKAVDLHMLNYRNPLGATYDKLLCGDRIEVEFIDGQPLEKNGTHSYIPLNPSPLTTPINLNSPATGASSDFRYTIVGCAAGDTFIVNADGGSNQARAWAFLDNGDKIVDVADANVTLRNELLTAPESAVTLVINDKGGYESFRGRDRHIVQRTMTCLSAQYDLLKPENSSFKIGVPEISANIKYRESANKKISTPTKKNPPKDEESGLIGLLEGLGIIEGGEDPDNPPT